jgi:amino acid adenylation domain-containing protein
MGAELYRNEPVFRAEVDRSAELLYPRLGLDLRQVLYPEGGDPREAAERLEQTALAQPALFVVEYALARLWMAWGVRPEAMLGHSLGEYVAACLAGVFSLADALALVAERGRLMQGMPGGAMLAVPLPEAEVRPLLGGLSLAAVNGPAMCVVAGEPGEIAALAERLVDRGLEGRRLHTSHAFHSASMEPVLDRFAAAFAGLRLHAPAIPFVSNLTGTWIRTEEATSPDYWVRHLRETVRFSNGLAVLFGRPGAVFLEVGPGRALTSLVRQHPSRPGAPSVLASLPTAGDGRTADAAVLRTLGELWLAGVEIDWRGFHAGERRLRVPLPTYPFERRRYWVEPDTGAERVRRRAVRGEGGVDDWFWVPLWRQALPPANGPVDGAEEGSWLLFADGGGSGGLGDRLAARLRERGREVVVARAGEAFVETDRGDFALRPGSAADYGALLDRLAQGGIVPTRIVHLWSVGAAAADAAEEQERGFLSLFHLARALGERRSADRRPPLHLGIVSTGVQRITGTDELIPVRATLLGLATTLPQEYPEVRSVAIDVTLPPAGSRGERQLVDLVLAELATAAEPVVAYRGTDRWLRVFEPLSLPPSPATLPLRAGGTYLITGGLGGVGLELAGLLARQVQAKLVLVGRTPFPEREAWPALARGKGRTARTARRLTELEAAGAEVWTAAADVTDRGAMLRVLDAARRRFGRIDGAIHAAGLPGGGLMQLRSPAAVAAVLAPKVTGTLVLAALLAADPPDFLVLCSSLNALVGGLGQSDYAAANAFLDAFAQSRPGELPVVSINWDAWRNVGMTDRRQDERLDEDTALPEAPMLEDLRPFSHPLLHERGIDGEGSGVFVSRLCPREDWILDEHRLGGHPVVPGTAYLEMAGAAFRGMEDTAADGAFEIRDVQFIAPLRIGDDERREVQTVLRRNGDGFHHFSVRSRNAGGWEEHVSGTVGAVPDVAAAPIDLSSFSGWEEEVLGADYREDLKQAGLGPRWEVLKKIYRRGGELVGLLELAPEFQGDVLGFKLHPALFDAATSFAEYYVPGARGNYYLPLSYKQLHVRGPLPSRIYSRVRLHDADFKSVETLSFDIAVLDEAGRERIRVDEFTMKRVDVSAALRGHAQKGSEVSAPGTPGAPGMSGASGTPGMLPGLEASLEGMDPERAVEAFRRVLAAGSLAQVAVSVRPLPEVFERARSLTVERLAESVSRPAGRHARPDLATPYVAPEGKVEERLAAIWSEVLGLDRVGAADDFFELGGHSLLGTQMISRVREAFGVEVPLARIFEAATIADFAVVIDRLLARAESAATVLLDTIPRLPRGGDLELSFSQERLWFLEQLEPGSAFYSIPGAVRMEGPVSSAAFAAALVELVRRHESLRTTFGDRDGRPLQSVAPPPETMPLPRIELSGLPESEREAELFRLVKDEVRRPFDLLRGPLLRVVLLGLDREDQVVVYLLHHIIADAWSGKIFLSELATLYEAFVTGRPSPLPPVVLQYADYAAWQRRYLAGDVLAEQLAYWRARLAGCPVLELPTDRPRPAIETFHGRNRRVQIPVATTRGLHELSRSTGASLFMVLLAVFKTLLLRTSGQSDLAVGSPIANRGRKDLEGVIGFFANTVVLRTDLAGNPSFRELLLRVREVTLGAYAHEQLPFERLVEEIQPERDMSRNPLFQVMCVLQNQPSRTIALGDLRMSPLLLDSGTAKFDLTIMWEEQDEILHGMVEHNTDLFDDTTVARLYRQHEELFAAVLAHPEARLLDLPLLGTAERHQLVVEWNDTVRRLAEGCVHERVEGVVRQKPDAVAARFDGSSLSFGELNTRANRLAHGLRRRGVGAESLVGICIGRSLPMVVAALGVLKAGGGLVALDPAYPLERLAMIVEDAGLTVLLADEAMLGHFPEHREIALLLDGAVDPVAGESAENPVSGVGPDHPMYAIYTSGSTGRPKGIVVPHRAFSNFLEWQLQASGGEPVRTVQFAAFGFCVSFQEIFSAWCSGGTLVVAGEMTRRDLGAFGGFLESEGIERLHLPYAALKQLAESSVGGALRPSRLREVITAGEPLKVTSSLRQLFSSLKGCTLSNQYGASETHVVSALTLPGTAESWPALPAVGRAVANVRIHLLDGELRPVPIGVRGELYAGGECVSRCYLKDPALTAWKLVPDPYGLLPGDRLYRTGDLARRLADGQIESLGRLDGQVKVRGFRVELGEVETVLAQEPGVRDVAVVPQGHGEGLRLVAYVVQTPESGPAGDLVGSLRQSLERRLPEYMVPAAFVTLSELPVNANGKLDVPALPAPEARRSGRAYRPPRTPVEELLAGLWREVLGVERVGLEDSFFDLGGYSLLATQVVSRARSSFGVELPLRALFEAPTLSRLAQRIELLFSLGGGGRPAMPKLVPVERSGPLQLSFAQERLWFLDQLEPGSTAYNLPAAVRLEGELDLPALARSLLAVTRRHATLRTTFAVDGELPVQVIAREPCLLLAFVDLAALPSGRTEAEALRIAAQEPSRPFDLVRGPLLRSALVRLSAHHHIELFTLHHAVADGWSLGVLVREVAALYGAFAHGLPSPLPALPIQYADYARWQREWLTGAVLEEQIGYWRERLAGAPMVLDLPTDRPRPAMQTFRGATLVSSLPAADVAALEGLARRHGATLFMVLLAAFETLLHRVTGQDCLLVGSTIANRTHQEIEDLIGFFVNTLVMRADFPAGMALGELLTRTRESALGAYAHQDLPFEKLVEELATTRDPSRPAIVQVVMQLQNVPLSRLTLPGLALSPVEAPGQTAKFDLGLSLAETADGLRGVWEYNTDLFDASTVERLVGRFERLLSGIAARPEARIADLSFLSLEERHQLLGDWSGVTVRPGPERCLNDLVAEQVVERPEAVAVVCGGESVSYGELGRRAARLARRLRGLGVAGEARVGLLSEPSIERVVGLLGILQAGGAYVPLDPEHPPARLAWVVDSSGMRIALAQESLRAKLTAAAGASPVLPVLSLTESARAAAVPAGPVEGAFATLPANLAYLIYTSGSTGRPNGVLVPHRGAAELIATARRHFAVGPSSRVAQLCPFTFDASVLEIFLALGSGATLVVARNEERLGEALGSLLVRQEVTMLSTLPPLLETLSPDGLVLRAVTLGGDRCPASLAERWSSRVALYNCYGPTETSIFSVYDRCREGEKGEPAIGRPVAGTDIYLLDHDLQPVPSGSAGELLIGGAGLARGYAGQAERTAERFVPHPSSPVPGERLYRTGDLARFRPDGRLSFLGRIDTQVKVRGVRIEPGEIEAVLAGHGEVRQAVVVAREDLPGGRGLVGFVVAREGSVPAVSSLRHHLLAHLPAAMVPARLVVLAQLPTTVHGKVDRRALAGWRLDEAQEPTPSRATPPRTPTEELLASLFADLLGRERIGVEESFFELGGHSLLATRLVSRVREAFKVDLPLRDLFEAPTVVKLADRIERASSSAEGRFLPPIAPVPRVGDLPLSFAQQRLWVLDQLEPGSTAYHMPLAVRLTGELDPLALHRSLGEILRRHEALRTCFEVAGGSPRQVISPFVLPALPRVDLTALGALSEGPRETELRRLSHAEARRLFDLRQGPLFRATLVALTGSEHALLATLHHIVSDGWSIGVLLSELTALYSALRDGRPALLPALPIQYADFARWQREWLSGAMLGEQIGYWRERLAGAPLVLDLPTDRPRPAIQSYRGATLETSFPEGVAVALGRLARRHGATLFMVLLAAFETLLYRVTGQDCLLVGSTIANRNHREIENLIGFFVNTLVMRADLSGEMAWGELLAQTRESALKAYAHQDLPFEKLVEELATVRDPSRPAIVQVVMQLQNLSLPHLALPGLAISPMAIEAQTAKFDLGLSLAETAGGLRGLWEYNTDLFDAATIERLVGRFHRLLGHVASLVAHPEARIAELPLLAAEERHQLLDDWSGVAVRPGPERCLHDLVAEQGTARPQAVAVVCGAESLSYGELDRRAQRLARRLRGLGVRPEVRVGLLSEPSIERVVGLLGVLRAGGAYVPLDPEHPPARLAWSVESSGMTVALAQESLRAKLTAVASTLPVLSLAEAPPAVPAGGEGPVHGVLPANLAYVIYTSGSTGRPNGVLVPHRGVAELIAAVRRRLPVGPASRLAQVSSFSFDASVLEVFLALGSGATLVVARSEERLGEALEALLVREAVTILTPTPAVLETLSPDGLALRAVTVGGDRCPASLASRWSSRVELYNCYGPTETSIFSLYGLCPVGEKGEPAIGRPVAGMEVYLLDRDGQLVPPGSAGELLLGGAGLTRGYAGQAERTAERFVPHPGSPVPGARLYRTGDLARFRPDGRLEFLGRIDHQVKVRGVRIEPGEIEAVLASHGAVRQVVVVAREDLPGGRGLVAFVVAQEESVPTVSSLRQHAAARLPEAMVPARFLVVPHLPTTVSGKLDRRSLAVWPLDEAHELKSPQSTAPRTPTEELLANLFADLLGRGRVGIDDNFFELGGHSLLATRLVSRVREGWSVDLPVRELFESPTVMQLAARIQQAKESAEGTLLPPVEPVGREGSLPLSFAQQRLWVLHHLEPGSTAYHLPLAVRLSGRLDAVALHDSLGEILRRHEALRTHFEVRDGSPSQVISPFVPPALPRVDLTALAAGPREKELLGLIQAQVLYPFDLGRGPLFRATLVALDPPQAAECSEHALLTAMHHIVSDGWSLGVLMGELAELYAARLDGRLANLPALPVQYADYAVWQRRWLSGEVLAREIAYWRQILAGVPVLELPADRPRHWARSGETGARALVLPAALTTELVRLGRRQGVTLFMVLLAAFDVLLNRYTGQEDVAVGSPIANRTRHEIEGLVGFFVNTLVLRTAVAAETGAVELLKQVRETTLSAYAHQDVPFEKLVEELQPERGPHRSPFFQVLLALQNAALPARPLPGLTLTPLPSPTLGAKYELTLSIAEAEDGSLQGRVDYVRDLFDPVTVDRLMAHFTHLLAAFAAAPERAVGELPLLGAAERHQLLDEWNDSWRTLPRPAVLHRLFAEEVARRPEAVALVAAGERITYAELDRRADRLARRLRRRGLPTEAAVGVFLERSLAAVMAFLAVLKAGGAYVPLDPSYPLDRLEFMLGDTQAPFVLTNSVHAGRLSGLGSVVLCLDADDEADGADGPEAGGLDFPPAVDAGNLAYILYTSGSTGRPKGVAVPHRAVVRLVRETDYAAFGPDEVVLQFAPVAFDASTFEIWGALLNGGQVALAPNAAAALADLGDLIDRHGITTVFLTTALFHLMVDHQLERLRPLRQVLTGGELMSPGHVRQALSGLAETRLTIFYGPTENTTFTSYCPLRDPAEVGASVPLGRPIANSRAYVLDDRDRMAPIGVVGELCAAGEGLARGYLNRPELTAERFVPDPWGMGGRLYRTGDLARVLPDGRLDFLGRIDHQVKLRGFRIEPGEIEARLAEHPTVREATVVVHEQPVGNRFLVAYVVGAEASAAELRAHLRAQLPEYMVPTAFVVLESLPLTPNGKVDRRRLPAPSAERPDEGEPGLPAEVDAASEAPAEPGLPVPVSAPLFPVAELLTELWRDLLRIEDVGLADDFFELGGYSLIATALSLRVREAFGIEISLHRLFDDPTLGGLVAEVEEGLRQDRGAEPPPLLPVDRGVPLPLSFAQQRLWIVDQLEPGSTAYHVPLALRLTGTLDFAALDRALGEIVRRHEALRTRFEVRDGSPFQVISPYAPLVLPRVDLTALGVLRGGRREEELLRLAAAEALHPFDLRRGPLFRATLVELAASEPVENALLTTMHHIVSDGWSVGVLLSELTALYGALKAGRPSPLPELPVQYADYAVWQRRWLSGEVLEQEIAYWRQALAGVPVLELPVDRPRHWTRSGVAGTHPLVLPLGLTAELVQLGRRQGGTLFMVLLAAFEMLLHRYSGQEDLAVGSPIANRSHRETERLVGFFVNTLALRTAFPADARAREVLKRVRETALGAYSHQDVPFEKLVEELRPERGPHRSPFFQVFFILQNAPLPGKRLPGLAMTLLPVPSLGAKFELTVSLAQAEDGTLQGGIEYGRELFDPSTIDRLTGHFTQLLAAFAAAPERAVGELPLLAAAERHQLLVEWNDTRRALPRPAVVHLLFAEQAALRPDAVALLSATGVRVSYGELDRRADRLARRLLRLGLAPESPVGVFLERSPEMVTALLAVLKAGGAYLPLDPAYPAERLEFMLRDTRAPLVITDAANAALADRLSGQRAAVVRIDGLDEGEMGSESAPDLPTAVDGANLAYVIYTSGSTGQPKGVCVVHEGIVRLVREGGFATLGPDDVVLHVCPVSFDVATFEIWGALLSGSILSILPSGAPALEELGEAIARDGITSLWLTSGLFTLMVNHRLEALRPVRQILAGGDVVPLPQAERVLAELPGCRLIDGYGPTENTTFTACHPIWQGLAGRSSVPIGRPIGNTRVVILDRDFTPVPVGVAGELYTGGLGLARGYFERPELTAQRFVPDAVSGETGERLYGTGDAARWLADGTIEFLGRLDHQVKVRGFRIELGEIETVLGRHPAILESVVVTREDRPGDRRLVAYVVPAAGLEPAAGELAGFLRQTLPEYMIPGIFVTLGSIPLSPNSKPDRAALPPPPDVTLGTETSYVPPRSRLEERIAAIWREVLGVSRVGVHDNFFSLGGHSLLLLQAVARLRDEIGEEIGRSLTPIELFEYPTVAALAKRLAPAEEKEMGTSVLEQSRDRGASRRQSVRRRPRGVSAPSPPVPEEEEG